MTVLLLALLAPACSSRRDYGGLDRSSRTGRVYYPTRGSTTGAGTRDRAKEEEKARKQDEKERKKAAKSKGSNGKKVGHQKGKKGGE